MAVVTDAAGEKLARTTGLPSSTSTLTMMGWFRHTTSLAAGVAMAVGNANTAQVLETYFSAANRVGIYGASSGADGTTPIVIGRWYHLAMVSDSAGAQCRLYLDGRLEATLGTAAALSWVSLNVGNEFAPTWDTPLLGASAYVRYWDGYALRQGEIIDEILSRRAVRRYGLYADWPIDTHIDVQDRGGFGRHLTPTGTLTTQSSPITVERDRIGGRLSRNWLVIATGGGPAAITGTGSMIVAPATIAASGAETFTGTAAETAAPATVTGQATEAFTATGALTAQAATIGGQAAEIFTGTGEEAAAPAQLSGTGAIDYAATGTLSAQPAQLSGSGAEAYSGTAALSAPPATIAGDGAEAFTGTAAAQVAPAQISGSGIVITDITGTGAVAAASPTLSGSASLELTGSGSVEMQAPTMSAEAVLAFSAQANVIAAMALLSGSGSLDFSGTANVTAAAAMLYAVATGGTEALMGTCSLSVAALGSVLLQAAALGDVGLGIADIGSVNLAVSAG